MSSPASAADEAVKPRRMLSKLLASLPWIAPLRTARSTGESLEHSPYPTAPERVRRRRHVYARLDTGSRTGKASSATISRRGLRGAGISSQNILQGELHLPIPERPKFSRPHRTGVGRM